ncbi:hypothetical protein AB990_20215 [Alkalihalobacillus pseudalcaliphilus]|nr:hypothetical protein AB990_20215 [Alkalihalobacillus pseudalcaliphilus]
MRKAFKTLGITLLAGSLLVACNDDDTDTPVDNDDNGLEEDIDKENDNESDKNPENDDGEDIGGELGADQEFDDQLDLGIGNTAQISSNQGAYEITLNSVSKADDVDGESSPLSHFIITNLTIKNIGDGVLDAYDTVGVLHQNNDVEGSGAADYSHLYESIEGFEGSIEPGEEITADAIYNAREGNEQFLYINQGLIAADGIYNEVVWSFTEDEME